MTDRDKWIWERAYYKWIDEGEPSGQGVRHFLEACKEYDAYLWNQSQLDAQMTIAMRVPSKWALQDAIGAAIIDSYPGSKIVFRNTFVMVWLDRPNQIGDRVGHMGDWRAADYPRDLAEAISKNLALETPTDVTLSMMRYVPVPEKAA